MTWNGLLVEERYKVQSMDIKSFKKGQKAYILDMHTGRNQNPEIYETTVVLVGRKYVTVDNGSRYESTDDSYSLKEVAEYGDRRLLCPIRKYADLFVERDRLRIWFRQSTNRADEYTLAQLRDVYRILKKPDKKIKSIREADLRGLQMPVIAVYKNPKDYPTYCVARIFDADKPTDTIMMRYALSEIEEDILKNTSMVFIPRTTDDVDSLVGMWM